MNNRMRRFRTINIKTLWIVIIMIKLRITPSNLLKTKKMKGDNRFLHMHIINKNLHLKKITVTFYLTLQTLLFIMNSLLDNHLVKQSKKRKEPLYSEKLILLMQMVLFSLVNFQEVIIKLLTICKCNKVRSIILIAR